MIIRTALVLALLLPSLAAADESPIRSPWIDKGRVMVIYNTTRMDSIEAAEKDSFSRDMGGWYMKQYREVGGTAPGAIFPS